MKALQITAYIRLLRPIQWLKNLMIFFPPFLGGVILQPGLFLKGLVPFCSFCFAASATYIFNDIIDRSKDIHHPVKRHRPVTSGTISLSAASALSAVLLVCALFLGHRVSASFMLFMLLYLAITVAYSLRLKDLPIVDLFCISAGFLLRLQAGGEAFQIVISEWLFLSVFLLAIFLSTGKRLCEKNALGDFAGSHRKSLLAYPASFLDGTMYMTGGAVLVTYTMYVISRHAMVYTVPLCAFGLLRYIFRVKMGLGGDPTESLLKDVPLLIVGVLWTVMVGWGMYAP